ncbi:ABC transporter substrate-binding protein [Streptomyces sp. NPDC057375]|uniref:ABC transporter substrate-binding protein n=1 Tax=Streptomyces sp. NPDC057375 TaxID=3346109 RepID=UPI0036433E8C
MGLLVVLLVLAIVGVGTWILLPAGEGNGKAISVGTTDAATTLDPAGAYDSGSWELFSNIFQSLLTFAPGGVEPVPDAAEQCGFVGTGLRAYRCTLRDGISFPSGRAMTAEDVKYSFDRVKKIGSDVGPASLFGTLASVTVSSNETVVFHLSSPDATFPLKIATGAGSIVDMEKYPATSLRAGYEVDGTGPYLLTAYVMNAKVDLEPNARYKGYFETGHPIELRYYKDSDQLDSAWKAHKVDVATRTMSPDLLSRFHESDPDRRVTESETPEARYLYLNTRQGSSLQDAHVRRAMAWLVNRDVLAMTLYKGTVDPLYSLIPIGMIGHTTPFFDNYPAAPSAARARSLLIEAGVSTPVRFTLGYGEGRGASAQEAALLKKQLEVGGLFKVNLKGYQWTEFQKNWAAGEMDAWTAGWVADYPDPDTFGASLVGTGSSMNTGYSDKQVDRLIADSRQFADRGRTSDAFRDLQIRIAKDVPLIPLWQRKDYVVSTEDVGGGEYLADGTGVFRLWRLRRI